MYGMMLPDFSKNFATQTPPGAEGGSEGGAQHEKVLPQEERSSKQVDIRYILAVLLLTVAIVATGGMFGLNAYLDREIIIVESGIETLEEAIKIHDVIDLVTFDRQI